MNTAHRGSLKQGFGSVFDLHHLGGDLDSSQERAHEGAFFFGFAGRHHLVHHLDGRLGVARGRDRAEEGELLRPEAADERDDPQPVGGRSRRGWPCARRGEGDLI